MENIDKFDKLVAEIFSLLYESFPIGNDIMTKDYLTYDENGEIFNATINFLTNEGFIRFDGKYYDGYVGVVLTMKGFAVLHSTPKSVSEKETETLGEEVKDVLKTGKDELIKGVIREIFKVFVWFHL